MNRSLSEMNALLEQQKNAFSADKMPSASVRIERLSKLKDMLQKHRKALLDAMTEDFSSRSHSEMLLTEFSSVIQNINYLSKNLKKWMKTEKRHLPLHLQPGSAKVMYQPLGVVGIMVPFNYPIFLACSPLATALATGNRAMIKMSEDTPNTSAVFEKIIAETFSEDLVHVETGEMEASVNFSKLNFDHLIFTGSGAVAKHVMKEAAANLTPVTLELGGKSPVIIDDFNLEEAAKRICFGKSMNAGQTCVAPDYIFVKKGNVDKFIKAYSDAFNSFFPSIGNNSDYAGIINDRHYSRLEALLQDATDKGATLHPVSDEQVNDGSRRFKPHLVSNTNGDMRVMQEEIFGPILPIITYDDISEAIDYINENDRPLALYYFGNSKKNTELVLQETHSGGVSINEVMLHAVVDDMPFGGVGSSGMGQYHGKEGFLTLSKAKSILHKSKCNSIQALYPPYENKVAQMLLNYLTR